MGRPRDTSRLDAFELDDPTEYGEDKFYVRATDKQGHQKTVHVAFTPNTYRALVAIIHDEQLSGVYKTPADLVRDAVAHRVHWLQDNMGVLKDNPDLAAIADSERRDAALEGYRAARAAEAKALKDAEEMLYEADQAGDVEGVEMIVAHAIASAQRAKSKQHADRWAALVKRYGTVHHD
jgi:hypothetical protein